jgi:hypothetical protein
MTKKMGNSGHDGLYNMKTSAELFNPSKSINDQSMEYYETKAREDFAANEADNVSRAEAIREIYKCPSADALALAAKACQAAEAQMDDVARAPVAAGLPAWGPLSEANQKKLDAVLAARTAEAAKA